MNTKIAWKRIWQEFRRTHPLMTKYAYWRPHDQMRIWVRCPDTGAELIYDYLTKRITILVEPHIVHVTTPRPKRKRGPVGMRERNLKILEMRDNGTTLEEIAKEYDISHQRVQVILNSIRRDIRLGRVERNE